MLTLTTAQLTYITEQAERLDLEEVRIETTNLDGVVAVRFGEDGPNELVSPTGGSLNLEAWS